jgi:hypothetical protein
LRGSSAGLARTILPARDDVTERKKRREKKEEEGEERKAKGGRSGCSFLTTHFSWPLSDYTSQQAPVKE